MKNFWGNNWRQFLNTLNEKKIEIAKDSLTEFLGLDSFQDKTFLDIGCGSGLFSYCAYLLGAEKIISFDIDERCVESCKFFYKKAGSPPHWEITKGDILDKEFVSRLPKGDIVYSYGVFHYTGNMWLGLENAFQLVENNGFFYFAIFNKKEGIFGSEYWKKIKKFYTNSPKIIQVIMLYGYLLKYTLNLKKYFLDYYKKRGMNKKIDVKNWLGGYPYEFASVEEVVRFVKSRFPDMELINIKTNCGTGNNHYLFKRTKCC